MPKSILGDWFDDRVIESTGFDKMNFNLLFKTTLTMKTQRMLEAYNSYA